MIWELFLIGTFWFWALIAVEFFWLLACLHQENGWGIGLSLLGLGAILWLFGDFNVFAWIWTNPILMLECAAGYLLIGVGWSLSRWKMFCVDVREVLQETRSEFLRDKKITEITDEHRDDWRDRLRNATWPHTQKSWRSIDSIDDIIPQAGEHKGTIMYWMGYWPLSMLWFFLHDMIERFFTAIYRKLKRLFQSIAQATFAGIQDDIAKQK